MSALALVSCNKEQVSVDQEARLTIVSSDIIFDAAGGTGSIVFEANGPVSAECKSEWCQVSLNGNTVEVTAPEYGALEGRSATITLTCIAESVRLSAQQCGAVFSFIDKSFEVEMTGETFEVKGKSSKPVSASSADDWITVEAIDGGFNVTVAENTSGDKRTGHFSVSAGELGATYTVVQKFDKDFSGSYSMFFYTATQSTSTASSTVEVTLTRDEDDENIYYIEGFLDCDKIPLYYDFSSERLYIKNATYLGQYTDGNYMYVTKGYMKSTSLYYNYPDQEIYYIKFSYEYSGGKYVLTHDATPPSSSYDKSIGFTVFTYSVAPDSGTAIAKANRLTSIQVVRDPVLTQQ